MPSRELTAAAEFTPNEVAILAEVAPRTVRKAIEEGVLRTKLDQRPAFGRGRRQLLTADAVLYMTAMREIDLPIPVAMKRRIAAWLRNGWSRGKNGHVPLHGPLSLNTGRLASKLRKARARALRYRRNRDRWIVRDPGILGGTPVIRGTRMTVYSVLGRVTHGDTLAEVAEENYDIPLVALETALTHARAVPMRGRPGGKPWLRSE